jgi:CheY-like chemotaxis protein
VLNENGSLREKNAAWLEKHRADSAGHTILIAEDSESDVFFLLHAFSRSKVKNPIYVVRTGREAMDYLSGVGDFADRTSFPFPGVVFLDLLMPHPDGFEILKWKSKQSNLPRTLWVAMSNFDTARAINEAYSAGATTFLSKPLDAIDVQNLISAFEHFWLLQHTQRLKNDSTMSRADLSLSEARQR